MRIHEYLEIDENNKIRCIKCGYTFCDANENYKLYALKCEREGSEIGKRMVQDSEYVVYHEFYCPKCLTMLSVDVLPKGHPPIWDIEIDLR